MNQLSPADTMFLDATLSDGDGFRDVTRLDFSLAFTGHAGDTGEPAFHAAYHWMRGDPAGWTLDDPTGTSWRVLRGLCAIDTTTNSTTTQNVRLAFVVGRIARVSTSGDWTAGLRVLSATPPDTDNAALTGLNAAPRLRLFSDDASGAFSPGGSPATLLPLRLPIGGSLNVQTVSNADYEIDAAVDPMIGVTVPSDTLFVSAPTRPISWSFTSTPAGGGRLDTSYTAISLARPAQTSEGGSERSLALWIDHPSPIAARDYVGHLRVQVRAPAVSGQSTVLSFPLTASVVGAGLAAGSALSEVLPHAVQAGLAAQPFDAFLLPNISGTDTGVNRLFVSLPPGYGIPSVTAVDVNGTSATYTDLSRAGVADVFLTSRLVSSVPIHVHFLAATPTALDSAGSNLVIAFDDSSTTPPPQTAVQGNANGIADGDNWRVTVQPGPMVSLVISPRNALIDQSAVDNVNVTKYHTYFNQTNNLVGYARVTTTATATEGSWAFLGNNSNGISIADGVLFYAPMALGPGSPNTVYYGSDRLYRSANQGTNHTVVSQAPITAGADLSAIGISPQNDNVRIVGLNNGQVWMTQTGSSVLTNVTSGSFPVSATSTRYVARAIIDPNNTNTAWVSFGGFGMPAGQHVWKTTHLAGGASTWVAAGTGIPDVPINGLVIDPMNSNEIFAGTDIGVYHSSNGGLTWFPHTTGMPVVAVFDIAIQNFNRTLPCATHGRGIWERLLDTATPTLVSLVGSEVKNGRVFLSWYSAAAAGGSANLYRRYVPGDWQKIAGVPVDGDGHINYEDADVLAYGTYEYRLGITTGGREEFAGAVQVDVAAANRLALRGIYPNPTTEGMLVSFALPNSNPATIEIVDLAGRRLLTRQVGTMGAGQHQLDLRREKFAPGIYWVRLLQGDRMFTARSAVVR